MERFDGKLHADRRGMLDASGDAFRDLATVFRETEFRFGATDENDLRSAHGGGLIQGAAVIVKSSLAFLRSETGEKATAHERDGLHSMIVEQCAGLCEGAAFQPLTPEANSTNPSARVFFDSRGEIPWLGGHRVNREAIEIFHSDQAKKVR
jgi:hypothetical protein